MTTEWRIVPVEPTGAMVKKAYPYCTDDAKECWDEIIAAAPRASEDEALVERLAHTLAPKAWSYGNRAPLSQQLRQTASKRHVRAILKALETPHD